MAGALVRQFPHFLQLTPNALMTFGNLQDVGVESFSTDPQVAVPLFALFATHQSDCVD